MPAINRKGYPKRSGLVFNGLILIGYCQGFIWLLYIEAPPRNSGMQIRDKQNTGV